MPGLRDQSKYLVSHMKDKREYGPVDMLKELRENDEARYPANTAHRIPENQTVTAGTTAIQDRKGLGYIARPTNVEPYPDVPPGLRYGHGCCSARTWRMLTTKGITSE